MRYGSQCLNDLYSDLITNSPQTLALDIPTDVGTGQVLQTTTKKGVILSDWQMNYSADVNVQGANSDEFIQIIFCFNEGVSWGMLNQYHAVTIQKGESCIYRGHGQTEYTSYIKDCDFSFKSIKIPFPYFTGLLSEYFESRELMAYQKKLFTTLSKVSITPAMERIFAEVKDFVCYRGGLGYLYLDGKMLELLTVYLSEVLELDILMTGSLTFSPTDRTAILEAKRIIDSQICYAPTCESLSRQVHLSVTKLTKGFLHMFGLPIHTYVIDQRLTKAAQLLVESDLNIGQIASFVGYTKPSNFSAAFKKKYGILPKNYRSTQIIG